MAGKLKPLDVARETRPGNTLTATVSTSSSRAPRRRTGATGTGRTASSAGSAWAHSKTCRSRMHAYLAMPRVFASRVEPTFYADVEYRVITSEGLLRATSFKGLFKGTGRT
jgi:hypothetical protein